VIRADFLLETNKIALSRHFSYINSHISYIKSTQN